MYKLIVFDLDKTLAEIGQGIKAENIDVLRKIESRGIIVSICSGKPLSYLCGFMRQVGLTNPLLIGENGASMQFGVDLPPVQSYMLSCSNGAIESLMRIKKDISSLFCGNIWFQPNELCVTPFPSNDFGFEVIEKYVKDHEDSFIDIQVFRHIDSFDFVPKGIDKKRALETIASILNIDRKDVIAVGDGSNDYPMFEFAGLSVGVNVQQSDRVAFNYKSIEEVLAFLLNETEEKDVNKL